MPPPSLPGGIYYLARALADSLRARGQAVHAPHPLQPQQDQSIRRFSKIQCSKSDSKKEQTCVLCGNVKPRSRRGGGVLILWPEHSINWWKRLTSCESAPKISKGHTMYEMNRPLQNPDLQLKMRAGKTLKFLKLSKLTRPGLSFEDAARRNGSILN